MKSGSIESTSGINARLEVNFVMAARLNYKYPHIWMSFSVLGVFFDVVSSVIWNHHHITK